MAEDIRVVVGGDASAATKAMAEAQRAVADARARVQRELDQLDNKITASQSKLAGFGKMFAGLAAGLSIGAVTSFAKGAIEAAGSIGELAEQAGLTTDGLQVLQFQAVQNNLSVEKLQKGVTALSDAMGTAAKGNDQAIQKFRDLGVGILDAGGKIRTTEAVLEDVAKAIMALEDPQARVAASSEIFGAKLGGRMLPLLAKLAQGFQLSAEEAKIAGAVLDKDLIDRMDRLSDKLAANARSWDAWAARVVDAVAAAAAKAGNLQAPPGPPQRGKNNALALALQQGGTLGGTPGEPVVPPPPDAAAGSAGGGGANGGPGAAGLPQSDSEKKRAAEVQNLIQALRQEREEIGKTDDEILRLKLTRELDVEQTVKQGKEIRKYTDDQVNAIVAEKQRTMSVKELEAAIVAEGEQQSKLNQLIATMGRQVEQTNAQAAAAKLSTVQWNALTSAYEVNDRELRILVETQRLMNEQTNLSEEKARELATSLVDSADALKKVNQGVERDVQRMNAAQNELEQFGEKTFDRLGDAAVIFGQRTGTVFDQIKSAGSAALVELQAEMTKLLLLNPIKNAIFGSNLPTASDVGGIFGRILGNKPGAKTAAVANENAGPEELGQTLPTPEEEGAPIIDAVEAQTDDQKGFFGDLGKGVTKDLGDLGGAVGDGLSSLGGIFSSLLTQLISVVTAGAASSGAGSAGGLLGLLGLGGSGGSSGGGAEFLGGGEGAGGSVLEDAAVTGFADGGVMTSRGRLPLRRYAGGGVANSPQVTMFGEGRIPEAFVPLPDGRRIPVQLSGNDNQAGGNSVTNNYIDATNADRQGLLELHGLLMRLAGPGVTELRAKNAVANAYRRGGAFKQAMGGK